MWVADLQPLQHFETKDKAAKLQTDISFSHERCAQANKTLMKDTELGAHHHIRVHKLKDKKRVFFQQYAYFYFEVQKTSQA